jgi:spore maturation protein CgeB
MALAADGDYTGSAKSVWPEYDQVSFDSADTLRARLTQYLKHPDEREVITKTMRQRVLDRLTYTATTRRLLDFISNDLRTRFTTKAAA